MVAMVGSTRAIFKNQALIAHVVGSTHCGMDAHISGDTSEHNVSDATGAEDQIEVSAVE